MGLDVVVEFFAMARVFGDVCIVMGMRDALSNNPVGIGIAVIGAIDEGCRDIGDSAGSAREVGCGGSKIAPSRRFRSESAVCRANGQPANAHARAVARSGFVMGRGKTHR